MRRHAGHSAHHGYVMHYRSIAARCAATHAVMSACPPLPTAQVAWHGRIPHGIHPAHTLLAPPGFDRSGRRYSLLEYALRETEQLHGKLRRYTSPGEHAFYPGMWGERGRPSIQVPGGKRDRAGKGQGFPSTRSTQMWEGGRGEGRKGEERTNRPAGADEARARSPITAVPLRRFPSSTPADSLPALALQPISYEPVPCPPPPADSLPALALQPISYEPVLAPWSPSININAKIMDVYMREVLPGITTPGDDNNYGSSR